jgi:thioredoxin reductase/NAD-dependent dihydropyrimidine dehydrogenase PreA subunit
MTYDIASLSIYALPMLGVLALYLRRHRRRDGHYAGQLEENVKAGLTEPSSLHPVIDPKKCLGSGACVTACPEDAIGIIRGKAHFINPTFCIGHGACLPVCPHDAIKLVFGTEKRGMDIPHVNPNFETNVPGLFIAGELGGMGLIRKSVAQGKQAIDSIRTVKAQPGQLDVVIVGAGPAGMAAGLASLQHKLRFVLLDQEDSLGGAVFHYPRNKIVMASTMELPMVGTVKMGELSKEALLEFWNGIIKKTGLKVQFRERMEKINKTADGFEVVTSRTTYKTRAVLLSIGRRGTPRKLDVPGEELPKVVYRLIDPEQYRNHHVLVVGGGDSALEAALSIAEEPGTTVTLSYRSEAFGRVKQKNRERLKTAEAAGRVKVLLESKVKNITDKAVSIEQKGSELNVQNDAVIVCAGGILPTPFLKELGIMVETKHGTE